MHGPAAEEQESGGASPEPGAGPLPLPATPGAWTPQHFACNRPGCGKLLARPTALLCGHVLCQPCLACDSGQGGSGPANQAAAGAAATAATGSPGPPPSPGAAGRYVCPACGMVARQAPAVCKQLADLLAELFPAESCQREAEVASLLQAAAEAAPAAEQQQQQPQQLEGQAAGGRQEPATPHASAATAGLADEQAAAAGGGQALSPSLQEALRRRQAAGGPGQALAQRLEQNLRRITREGYAHHGVGCDACGECCRLPSAVALSCGCVCRGRAQPALLPWQPRAHLCPAPTAGMYPIVGRRYRCADCPETM